MSEERMRTFGSMRLWEQEGRRAGGQEGRQEQGSRLTHSDPSIESVLRSAGSSPESPFPCSWLHVCMVCMA